MQKKNILVVDDDDALLFAAKKLFADTNISVDTAGTLKEAIGLIQKKTFRSSSRT